MQATFKNLLHDFVGNLVIRGREPGLGLLEERCEFEQIVIPHGSHSSLQHVQV